MIFSIKSELIALISGRGCVFTTVAILWAISGSGIELLILKESYKSFFDLIEDEVPEELCSSKEAFVLALADEVRNNELIYYSGFILKAFVLKLTEFFITSAYC